MGPSHVGTEKHRLGAYGHRALLGGSTVLDATQTNACQFPETRLSKQEIEKLMAESQPYHANAMVAPERYTKKPLSWGDHKLAKTI